MKFKVVFLDDDTNEEVTRSEHTYEEIAIMFNVTRLRLKIGDVIKVCDIKDKIYGIHENGLAVYVTEVDGVEIVD